MKITRTSYSQNTSLLNATQKNAPSKNIVEAQKPVDTPSGVVVELSEEGIAALRGTLRELKPEADDINAGEVKIQNTNEIAWEHYTKMRDLSSLKLKGGNYDLEDVMKSIMDTYETLYHEIVEAHENGARPVSYALTGKRQLTLEEDLAGLDEAFRMRLANLEGYITCQQTNKAFEHPDSSWYFRKNTAQSKRAEPEDTNYFDKEYQNTAVSMMEQARSAFLALAGNSNYKKGKVRYLF